MEVTQTQPPDPPAQGAAPWWARWVSEHIKLIGVAIITVLIIANSCWTNVHSDPGKNMAKKHPRQTQDGVEIAGRDTTEEDNLAAQQATIARKQRELDQRMAELKNARAANAEQSGSGRAETGGRTVELSPEQQALKEIQVATIKARYLSLWSAPIISRGREMDELGKKTSQDGSDKASGSETLRDGDRKASGAAKEETKQAGDVDPNKKDFPYDNSVGPYHVIQRFTLVGGTLENQVNSQTGGMVRIRLDRGDQVYVKGTKAVLWPEGSVLEGEAKTISASGQNLVGISLDRVNMPDGYAIKFPEAQGLSENGQTGVAGQTHTHALSSLGWSILLAGFSGISEIGNSTSGFGYDPMVTFRARFSESLGQQAQQMLYQKILGRAATVIIPAGTRVRGAFAEDLSGNPEYQNHRMIPGVI